MATVNFLYRSTKNEANLVLRLLFRDNATDYVYSTQTEIKTTKYYWNKQHKKRSKDIDITNKQTEINYELNKISNYVLEAFTSAIPAEVNKKWLERQIKDYYNPPEENENLPTELIKYFAFFMDCKKNEIAIGTQRKYNVTKSLLERYETEKKIKLHVYDIDNKFKVEFENYCIKYEYGLNTISKDLRTIKTVCNHAKQNGVRVSNQLEYIKTPQHKTANIYLTFEDLEKIANIDKRRLNEKYENAKDWLIISCYTGQRIDDFMRFNKSMIRYEKNKKGDLVPLLEFTQGKTKKNMSIAVHPKVMEILKKRQGNFPKQFLHEKYNLYIKEVCRLAELNDLTKGGKVIDLNNDDNGVGSEKRYRKKVGMYKKWKLVTSHIGRRSFATNFYGKIPTIDLMDYTGHSTETMLLKYIQKRDSKRAVEVSNYF